MAAAANQRPLGIDSGAGIRSSQAQESPPAPKQPTKYENADKAPARSETADEAPDDCPSSDEALAGRAKRGDRAAFIELVARYECRIYRLAMRLSRNDSDAQEITQETFLRAHRCMRFFRGESRFGTWLYRIAMNEALMRRRAARRRPVDSLEDVLPRFADTGTVACAESGIDDLVDGKTLARRVRQALQQLDEAHRATLVLRDLEELTAEQAADILGVSPEAVRQRAHRARLKLRELLADLADLLPQRPGARSSSPPRHRSSKVPNPRQGPGTSASVGP
ncbi:MAG TPA: sigma-70 family RNA polymerase sigma factor [Polyangiaceae bacterium]|nr:sigma-70 family RNA polymerase sigma factor [Polyangiaceae bacterium]